MIARVASKNIEFFVIECSSFLQRLRGMLGRNQRELSAGFLIEHCKIVHTVGMRVAIDLYFLDCHNRVVAIQAALKPNRISRFHSKASKVLEFVSATNGVKLEIGDAVLLSNDKD